MKENLFELLQSAPRINNTAKVVRSWKFFRSTHTRTISNMDIQSLFWVEQLKCSMLCMYTVNSMHTNKKSSDINFGLLLFLLGSLHCVNTGFHQDFALVYDQITTQH